jgi:hypothetical protein
VIGSLLQSASSGLTVDDSVASRLRMGHDITEVITLVDEVSSNGVLYSTVYDGIALNIEVELNGEIWECYVLNTPKMYPSVYSGFDFNSYCVFNGRSYGCRGDGVYELTGDTDNGSDIHSGVQLPMTKFDMPHQKRFRKAYVVASGAAPLMIMEAEDGTKKVYSIDSEGEVDTSRTKSRKWKLTITDFESLDAMRLIPIVLSR